MTYFPAFTPADLATEFTLDPATGNLTTTASQAVPNAPTNIWYVDPTIGKPTNDGVSPFTPWDLPTALGQAWAANGGAKGMSNPVVKPGDTFLLASGNYGDLLLQGEYGSKIGWFPNTAGNYFTLQAAPGATPVFTSIRLMSASNFVFRGLTVQQVASALPTNNYGALFVVQGDSTNLIIDRCSFSSASFATAATWSATDWQAKASNGFSQGRADTVFGPQFITLTNNSFQVVGTAIATQNGQGVLIKNNFINYFCYDGIDYAVDSLVIQGNTLLNRVDASTISWTHPDFMQGQPSGSPLYSNILIDRNICVRQTDPHLPLMTADVLSRTTCNGIGTFDGAWSNVAITNNIVVTQSQYAIEFSGVAGLLIQNNVTIPDGANVNSFVGIYLTLSKNADASSSVIVEGNTSGSFNIDWHVPQAVVLNNMALGGGFNWVGVPGYYANGHPVQNFPQNNSIQAGAASVFANVKIVGGVVEALNINPAAGFNPVWDVTKLPTLVGF